MKSVDAKILDATHLELSEPLSEPGAGRIEVFLADQVVESTPDNGTVPGTRLREREDAWCRSHPEILRGFEGQWVVVEGEAIVAHGADPARLVREAHAQGVRIPYVFYVEPPRPGVVRLGL